MKRLMFISLALFVLMTLGTVQAAQISIEPLRPTTDDDLRCLVDGQERPNGLIYEWFINDQRVDGRANREFILSSINTAPGDVVECRVTLPGQFNIPLGSAVTFILPAPEPEVRQNVPPQIRISFPEDHALVFVDQETVFSAEVFDPDNEFFGYKWDFGDGETKPDLTRDRSTVRHSFREPGVYDVSVMVTDGEEPELWVENTITVEAIEETIALSNIRTYHDKYFEEARTKIFFRDQSLYVFFEAIDIETGQKVPNLDITVTLVNQETGELTSLDPFTGLIGRIGSTDLPLIRIVNGQRLSGIAGLFGNPTGSYYYVLEDIPDSSDFLGENVVVAIALDQNRGGGQGEAVVKILNRLPEAHFEIPSELVVGEELLLDARESVDRDGEILIYEWEIKERQEPRTLISYSLTGSLRTLTFNTIENVEVTLHVADNDGGKAELTRNVVVRKAPQGPLASFEAEEFVLVNQEISFDASASEDPDGEIVEYRWNFDDGTEERTEEEVITHTFASDAYGARRVRLTVVDNDGLEDDVVKILDVSIVSFRETSGKKSPAKDVVNHEWRIQSVFAENYRSVYQQGETIPLLLKMDNVGNVDERVNIKYQVMGVNALGQSSNLFVEVGDGEILRINVATKDLQRGHYTLRLMALSPESTGSDLAYWQFILI